MVTVPWVRPIHTREGKFVLARPHEATFNGRHNAVKAKVLMVLYKLDGRALSIAELAEATGEAYNYIGGRASKWVEWGYLKRSTKLYSGRPVFGYSIARRGIRFVKYRIPHNRKLAYDAEMQSYKAIKGG